MANELVRNWKTKELLAFLREQKDLQLDFEDLRLIYEAKLTGHTFLLLTKDELKDCNLKMGSALAILNLIKNIKENNFTISDMPSDIPSFENIKTWKHPQAKYFEIYPYEIWSLSHFVNWAIDSDGAFLPGSCNSFGYVLIKRVRPLQVAELGAHFLGTSWEMLGSILQQYVNYGIILQRKRRDKIYLDNDHDEILKKAKITNKINVPILNVESLEGTSTTFKVVAKNETEANKKTIIPHCNPSFIDFRSEVGMLFVDKTIYIKKLEEEGLRFRVLFLRPRRFGKSAFLDMLCQYYDIKNADKFSRLFGPLYIGQHPTNSQNKCLVLKFDLSSINVHFYKMMEESFNGNVNHVLRDFVEKYDEELEYPDIDKLIVKQASISLQNVMSTVSNQFIGVDEYDTPGNNCAFKHEFHILNDTERNDVDVVEQFSYTNFFAVIKRGCCGPIDKLYVTGVAPAFRAGLSPLLILDDISERPQFFGICGFTEEEVQSIAKCYFDNNMQIVNDAMDQMRHLYFGYNFVNTGSNTQTPFLYNIHLIFHYLRERQSRGLVFKPSESAAVNSTKILTCIADQSPVSIDDLFKFLTNGMVFTKLQNNFNYSDFLRTGEQDIEYHQRLTWSFLYYFGILTRDYAGKLIIPNQVTRTEFQQKSFSTQTSCIQSTYTWLRKSTVDGMKKSGDGRFGFVDLFVFESGDGPLISNVVLELKYITITGLLSGAQGFWIKNPDTKIMNLLDKYLENENEEQLLQ
ncbi:5297_t:CDS:10, partial [Funneliformis geosporum]